jgi:hypothetical protein
MRLEVGGRKMENEELRMRDKKGAGWRFESGGGT